MSRERILFVTGRLAEPSLRRVLASLAPRAGFDYDVAVLGISVAALMHSGWVARKLTVEGPFDRVLLPGWCQGDLAPLSDRYGVPFERGPKDLFDLPQYFGRGGRREPVDLSRYDIEILAEINHAPRMTDAAILERAARYRDDGADVIDLGCIPGETWHRAGEVTRLLRADGHRVSIDSFERAEVEAAVEAGAKLVLSCNGTNREWASRLGAELVAVPDDPHDLATLEPTLELLTARGACFRIDPILEPIGFGFAASLSRYYEARRRWPDLEVMMGIGNLTELTEVDTAGVNVLLAALCQELGIRSVLATEVINWARTAVREFDVARRLVRHAITEQVLPKHVDSRLVLLRDPRLREMEAEELAQLARELTDPNYRIFAERGEIHLMNRDGYWHGTDPYRVFEAALAASPRLDAPHAFYLGYELCKAVTALTLGKSYTQDEPLRWGFLTRAEESAAGPASASAGGGHSSSGAAVVTRACDVVPGEPLVEELRPTPDVMTALEAVHDWPGVLLLESALVRAPVGRYSFLVADPVASYSLARPVHGQDPFEEIRRALAAYPTRPVTGLPPFQGGAAGLLSYELGQAWERVPSAGHDEFELPPLAVGIYDWVIAWDHADGRAWIVSQGYPECDPVRRTERAATRLSEVRQRLEMRSDRSVEPRPYTVAPALSSSRLASQHPAPGLPGLTSTFTRDGYLTAVERAIEYIAAGDVFQVNLSQRLLHPQSMPSLELYRRLRRCNPAPFAGYFAQDDWAVVSASPERFICVREGEVETRPIKGTRRRSPGPEADLFTRDALRESEKDQAENVMIVDLLRNDLSRVCSPGTIRVPKLCAVETYETVQHLVSEVRGSLRPGEDIWSLIAAAFPGGSITGAPKVRAMEIIAELEPTVRGPYCGSLFYAGFDGQSDSSLLIRTFTCRHGWVQCPVGGGIVAQSHPAAEYLETLHKAEGMLRAFH